ncbi:hypothetical protein Rs2_36469 [Raphanus sativus]|uniref:Uncharacterized protein LOC130498773 n=1 Tax=Raphanus sativus TaxID=3726 RepID=A0A9W3C9Y3_RAPSA|nr:uncharacterized protein LOC130498773 [Raphanus sativus]KAJ4879415.1 hypothetical protein Rs2_36469 [Raphanus sativus]
MGIASSIQIPPAKPEQEKPEDYSDWPYPVRAQGELLMKNIHGLFPSREGESSTDEAVEARYFEFLRRGGCKDVANALEHCEEPRSTKCKQIAGMLFNCMYSHHDYYQPVIALWETFYKQLAEDLDAFHAKKQRDESYEKANLFKGFKRF